MGRILCLLAICALSFGCSGEDAANSLSSPTGAQSPPTAGPDLFPIDYSKTQCGDVEECELFCLASNPYLGEEATRAHVCGYNWVTESMCRSMLDTEATNRANHESCARDPVTARISPEAIGTTQCKTDSRCVSSCEQTFPVEIEAAIERRYAAQGGRQSGAFLREIYRNRLAAVQLDACLYSPFSLVIGP